MNREIKFRAWDGKKMIFSENSGFYLMPNGIQVPSSTGHQFYDKNYPVMQFTGLYDKNGKEIYEGDITLHHRHGKKCVIKWIDNYMCFAGETIDDVVKKEYNFYKSIDCDALDIIGNIYENPDLCNH